jgi:hypothetical protein
MNPNLTNIFTINILPYISEKIKNFMQDDNKPRSFQQQKDMLDYLKLTEFKNMERGGYTGYNIDKNSDTLKPNLELFREELIKLCDINKKDETKRITFVPTTRCSVKKKTVNISERDTRTNYAPIVIVTHGQTLANFLKEMGSPIDKSERPNFVAYRVYFNHKTGHFIKNPKSLSYFYKYDNNLKNDVDVIAECKYESQYPACESEVCDTNKSVKSTHYVGGRRTRKKVRKHTQKNS